MFQYIWGDWNAVCLVGGVVIVDVWEEEMIMWCHYILKDYGDL